MHPCRRCRRARLLAAGPFLLLPLVLLGPVVPAQQPQPPKVPLPVINPANAKLARSDEKLGSPATSLAFVEANDLVVAGCEDGKLRVWAREKDKSLLVDAKLQTLDAHKGVISAVCASGATLVSAGSDGKLLLWSLPAGKPAATLDAKTTVRGVALSPDGKLLASVGDDKTVQLWDTATKAQTKKLTGPTDWLLAVAVSPDGKHVAAGGHDGRLWVWETASGKKVFDVLAQQPPAAKAKPDNNVVYALEFSPDGKTVALGGSDVRIFLFQANDGKFVRALSGHTGAITSLAFHPSGGFLLSTSKDRTVRLWNPQAGSMLKSLEGHTAWAQSLAVAERGTLALTAGADRSVRLWDLGAVPAKPKK